MAGMTMSSSSSYCWKRVKGVLIQSRGRVGQKYDDLVGYLLRKKLVGMFLEKIREKNKRGKNVRGHDLGDHDHMHGFNMP